MPLTGGEIRPGFLGDTKIEYNGYKFSEYTTFRWSESDVYDESGVGLPDTKVTLVVDSIIPKGTVANTNNGTADFDTEALRAILKSPNRKLSLLKTGYGEYDDIRVDTVDGVRPIGFVAENLGDGQTMRIVWTCEFMLKPTYGASSAHNVQSFNVSDEYQINERRRLVRTTTFVIKLKTAFQSLETFPIYREYGPIAEFVAQTGINLENWKAASIKFAYHDWTMRVLPDRRTAIITRTERQVDSDYVYPDKILSIDIKHKTASSLDKGFRLWTNEFSGTIVPRPLVAGDSKYFAWLAYVSLFRQRYELGIQKTVESKGYQGTVTKVVWPRILSIEIEEDVLGQGAMSFRIRYDQQTNSIADVWPRTGILNGILPMNDEASWQASIQAGGGGVSINEPWVHYGDRAHNYGYYENSKGKPITNDLPGVAPWSATMSFYNPSSPQQAMTTQAVCPPKEDSFRMIKEKWSFASARDIHRHERYKALNTNPNTSSLSLEYEIKSDAANETDSDTSDTFFAVTGTARQQLMYQGAALRYGGPTNPPDIRRHGNKELRLIDESIDDTIITSSGCPVHLTKWTKFFEIVGTVSASTDLASSVDPSIRPELKQHS